jgi:hypothetical protein
MGCLLWVDIATNRVLLLLLLLLLLLRLANIYNEALNVRVIQVDIDYNASSAR